MGSSGQLGPPLPEPTRRSADVTSAICPLSGSRLLICLLLLICSAVPLAVAGALWWLSLQSSAHLQVWLLPAQGFTAAVVTIAAGAVWLLLDREWHVGQRRLHEAELARLDVEHLAFRDALTGLANRRAFVSEFDRLWQRAGAGGPPFALHVLDLDDLKGINDRYGHVTGDRVLTALAERLRGSVRDGDVVARIGGDEFAVLQPGAAVEAAEALARRLAVAVAEPLAVSHHVLLPTVSVGTAHSGDAHGFVDMMQYADRRLYFQKATRRPRGRPEPLSLFAVTGAEVSLPRA